MSNKIVSPFLNTPLTLLLMILIIIIIFCTMHQTCYKSQPVEFNNNTYLSNIDENINEKIDENIIKLHNIIEDSNITLKDKFVDISANELKQYSDSLKKLSVNINNLNTNDLLSIQKTINEVKKQKAINKQQILDVLTNIYILRYIDFVNQGNAVSYHEFVKYQNPNQNTFYKQYL